MLVIGGGPNGLACAIRLAASGVQVEVLEAESHPGGAVSSSEATLPGFVHDDHAGFFPMTAVSPVFRKLPLERHGLRWINPPISMAHPFLSGESIALHRHLDPTTASIGRVAEGDGAAWGNFVRTLSPVRGALVDSILSPFPPLRSGGAVLTRLRRGALELGRRALGSPAALVGDLFSREEAGAWIAGCAMHGGLDPYAAGGGGFGLWLALLGHFSGWPYPRGGAGQLTEALAGHLRELGGNIQCHARVSEIEVSNGTARGVRLRNGERIAASGVISTLSARPFLELLPSDALSARLHRRLRSWRYGPAVCKVDWALSGPVPWHSEVSRQAGVVHLGDTMPAIDRSLLEARSGAIPANPAMVIGQHSLHDPSRAPEGQHTLYAYTHAPYDADGAEVADRMERRIEEFAPGFRDVVLERTVRSPQQLERGNPNLVHGDILGGSNDPDQQLAFRPAPELFRYRTPVRGLYMGGASNHPGGGVHGIPGAGAARAALRDRSRLRPWR